MRGSRQLDMRNSGLFQKNSYEYDNRILLIFGGILTIALLALVGCGDGSEVDLAPAPVTMQLTSAAFVEGETIPFEHTCDAPNSEDVSPQVAWSGVPLEAKSVALIVNDPAAPGGNWVHWMVYDIPSNITEIEAGTHPDNPDPAPAGARQGKNSFDRIGYDGPCRFDSDTHDYFFKIYALDTEIDLDEGASLSELTSAMAGHILAEGHLVGQYKHRFRSG